MPTYAPPKVHYSRNVIAGAIEGRHRFTLPCSGRSVFYGLASSSIDDVTCGTCRRRATEATKASEWDTLSPQAYEGAIGGSYADVVAAMQTPNVPCTCYHDDHWTGRGHLYGHPRPPVALEIGSHNAICLFCAEQHAMTTTPIEAMRYRASA